ncbi:alpha-amylase [Violaceomyces palustris]|uniref:Alpha-amylase n=1 Tax=Violaceomyces palustris TaxID=1673888 RepID=A0ACD0NXL5_9BASI|nr:alpha-amylase [Violaceomyces palustris]
MHVKLFLSLLTALSSALVTSAATASQWKNRTIYQIVTDRFATTGAQSSCNLDARQYCGGNLRGIIQKLDYIQGMGFDAIWISPVVSNTDLQGQTGYHGYWSKDIYSINPHFGTADDLKALSSALHSRGMLLMVDVVANHMGPQDKGASTGTSQYTSLYTPFSDPSHYHNFCTITNYNDQNNVEQCWLGSSPQDGLPDLNTENPAVVNLWNSWIKGLVSNYTVDGIRIDTVKHVRKDFWPGFVSSAGVYSIGEVFQGDPAYVGPYQQVMDGLLNYPLYYPLTRAFQKTNQGFNELINMVNSIRTNFKDPMALGNFLENQDNPRFPSITSDTALNTNAITYVLTGDGIPIIYYGEEQRYAGGNDPYNREALWGSGYPTNSPLYVHIQKVNKLRKKVQSASDAPLSTPLTSLYNSSNAWAFKKGNMLVVLSSAGQNSGTQTVSISSSSLPVTQMTDILSCSTFNVNSGGSISVTLNKGLPAVLYPTSGLGGSGLCGR